MWFIGVEVEQETSAKVLDRPEWRMANGEWRMVYVELLSSDIVLLIFIIIIFQQQ